VKRAVRKVVRRARVRKAVRRVKVRKAVRKAVRRAKVRKAVMDMMGPEGGMGGSPAF
jgi:hypothetical protein